MMSTFDRYAGSVHQLIRFAEVRKLFEWHISRWRRKKAVIDAHSAKAEEALIVSARRKKVPPEWPCRSVGIGTARQLIQMPPEVLHKVGKRGLMQESLRNRLTRRPFKDFTPTERFTLLAQIHDAYYASHRLGPTDPRANDRGTNLYLAGVDLLQDYTPEERRLTKSEATRLNDIWAFVLVRIEAGVDPTTKDDNGELLVDVIGRLRRKCGLTSSQTIFIRSQIASAKNLDGSHSPVKPNRGKSDEAKLAAARQRRQTKLEQEKWGNAWLHGRNEGEYLKYADMAAELGIDLLVLKTALECDRKNRLDVWRASAIVLQERRAVRRKLRVKAR